MAYDESLAYRIRQGLSDLRVHFNEKHLMGVPMKGFVLVSPKGVDIGGPGFLD